MDVGETAEDRIDRIQSDTANRMSATPATLEDAGVVPTYHDDLPQGEEETHLLEAMLAFTQGTGHKSYV
eukprot:m.365631 g.365631  ORF g.365631 m.365631 type:complete len:69 (+) comp16656_c0_seq21:1923-2129(+)